MQVKDVDVVGAESAQALLEALSPLVGAGGTVAAWVEGKSATVADLAPSTLYLLAAPSTPANIQNEVIADMEAGKPIDEKQIKRRIQEVKEATTTNTASAAMVEQEEIAQDEQKPKQKTERPFWESPEYIKRSEFKNACLFSCVYFEAAAREMPQLDAEWREAMIDLLKKVEVRVKNLRIKIEELHAESAPAGEHQEPDDLDDDDPLAIPAAFKRGRQES